MEERIARARKNWIWIRLLILVLALPFQSALARRQTPDYCTGEASSMCSYGGTYSWNNYCDSWYNCETCCPQIGSDCDGYSDRREVTGDGECPEGPRNYCTGGQCAN